MKDHLGNEVRPQAEHFLKEVVDRGCCTNCGMWTTGVRLVATTHRCGKCGAYKVRGLLALREEGI